ncbi:MAG: hypothetical protein KF869_05130 [Phycisphaeraceae bacterium]|nr:hypothetical protein [Phycisphaeraceae bacterium]
MITRKLAILLLAVVTILAVFGVHLLSLQMFVATQPASRPDIWIPCDNAHRTVSIQVVELDIGQQVPIARVVVVNNGDRPICISRYSLASLVRRSDYRDEHGTQLLFEPDLEVSGPGPIEYDFAMHLSPGESTESVIMMQQFIAMQWWSADGMHASRPGKMWYRTAGVLNIAYLGSGYVEQCDVCELGEVLVKW